VESKDKTAAVDRNQLREVTLDDEALMREVLEALVDDTRRQMMLLDAAIREQDVTRCVRLAHYSKGACANVGAQSAAEILKEIESKAAKHEFPQCRSALDRLAEQVDLIHSEAVSL
jgi:HPt (histidine-containing phosphotransfer) domain-containing protein